MNIKLETKVKAPFPKVKKAFVNKDGNLLKFLLPMFSKLLHYKGIRRGALLKIKIPFTGGLCFKIVTYNTSKEKLYFNDILYEGSMFGAKFWSHRHSIIKQTNHTLIKDDITFTTKNALKDKLHHAIIYPYFLLRVLKYKLYFWR